jgi:hypothetical protein
MTSFKVRWAIEGEMQIDAEDKAAAEKILELELVKLLTDKERWPAHLGAQSIQGAAVDASQTEG